jgi:acyl carrier protein
VSGPDDTLGRLLDLAATHFGVARQDLQPDDDFFAKLGVDSLKALDLLTHVEREFGVELPDWELQGVSDFRTLAARVNRRR